MDTTDPAGAAAAAAAQYGAGADVIFGAAGDSGFGVFRAATEASSATGQQLWAIGVDSDQYQTVGDDPSNVGWQAWQPHILTSMLRRADLGVYAVLSDYAHGKSVSDTLHLGLASGDVALSDSGGFIDGLRPMIDAWTAKIVAGSVVVPCIPAGRATQAAALGAPQVGCGG